MNQIEPSVVVQNLTKRFGDFVAVDNVSFEARHGEIFGFLGPNGSGKSTTIRILCGLLRLSSGRATVAGIDVARNPEAVRQHIGYMSQKFSLYNDLRVAENLEFFAGMYSVPKNEIPARIAWALKMAGLEGRDQNPTSSLAVGWKQRLALGCAVLHRPPIIFLDEPTSGVDPVSRRQFWDLIHSMVGEGVTVFVTTHYMDEAEYCNRLVMLDRGRIVAMGTPTELKSQHMKGQLLMIECEPLGQHWSYFRQLRRCWMLPSSAMVSMPWSLTHRLWRQRFANCYQQDTLAWAESNKSHRVSRTSLCRLQPREV